MAVKNTKTCPNCLKNNVQKRGIRRGIIRYFLMIARLEC